MLLTVKAASTSERERASLSIWSTANARAIDDIDPVMRVIALARKNHRNPLSCIAARERIIVGLRVVASVHPGMPQAGSARQ